MISSELKPIHNIRADGNSIVDVVIYQHDLWVRIISYKEHQNIEVLIPKDANPNNLEFGDAIKRVIPQALKYCSKMENILSLSDLSKESLEILEVIKRYEWIRIVGLKEETGLPEETIQNALDHLMEKYLITGFQYGKYAYQDRYEYLRRLYLE